MTFHPRRARCLCFSSAECEILPKGDGFAGGSTGSEERGSGERHSEGQFWDHRAVPGPSVIISIATKGHHVECCHGRCRRWRTGTPGMDFRLEGSLCFHERLVPPGLGGHGGSGCPDTGTPGSGLCRSLWGSRGSGWGMLGCFCWEALVPRSAAMCSAPPVRGGRGPAGRALSTRSFYCSNRALLALNHTHTKPGLGSCSGCCRIFTVLPSSPNSWCLCFVLLS